MKNRRKLLLRIVIFGLSAGILVCFYLLSSMRNYGIGFPLDDAWIHQTYARNLAETGNWFFQEGRASTGSTAPLWTVLLVPGYLLKLSPVLWSAVLGGVLLAATAVTAASWMEHREGSALFVWSAGLAVLLDWHMGWSAVSGMETIAASFWVILFFLQLARNPGKPFLLGALIGLGVWIRPDLITLLLPLLIAVLGRWDGTLRRIFTYFFALAGGLSIFVMPYLILNWGLSGEFWPTTFYAKQAEYSVMKQVPFVVRLLEQYRQPMIGVGGILFPGVVLVMYDRLKKHEWEALAPLAWVVAYLAMFAVRLPVTYQHGRYAMPTAAVVIILGLDGMNHIFKWNAGGVLKRLLSRSWSISAAVVLAAFAVIGADAYADDVAIIETEMVATARWINANTSRDALVAVHDIGAIAYYSNRELVDLAGLISPEVIPILRDEEALAQYITEKDVDYLVSFPSWYPELVQHADLVFQTDTDYSVDAGGENMAVYRWSGDGFAH